jgi:hypothetical protein
MGLCEDCDNMVDIGEDLCYQCIKTQETTEEEIINININKYSNYILEDILSEYINKVSLNIINKYIYTKDSIQDVKLIENYKDIKANKKAKKKRQKENQKFNKSLNRLYNLNIEAYKWLDNNIKSHYKNKAMLLIQAVMDDFHGTIDYDGINMESLRNAYRYIYIELTRMFEEDKPDTFLQKKDHNLLINKNWEDYSIYNS